MEGYSRRSERHHGRQTDKREDRKKITFAYKVHGVDVCRGVFAYVYHLTKWQLSQLQIQIRENAVIPRQHAGKGKTSNRQSADEVRNAAKDYIQNHATIYGIPQPAASSGRGADAPIFLPAYQNYKVVHSAYFDAATESGITPLKYHAFRELWLCHFPSVKFMTPRQDVCYKCELLRESVRCAVGEEEKEQAVEEFMAHIKAAQTERDAYRAAIQLAKDELVQFEVENSVVNYIHLTFDFAQNLQLPYHHRQVGPIYFKSPLKVNLFGICNEAASVQVNYLFHEGQSIGPDGSSSHSSNSVVSMLDHFLEVYTGKEQLLHFHADNCVGQNKNKTVMGYMNWRVMTGRNTEIKLSFMTVGHTRCSVDGCFGLIKKSYRRSDTDTLKQLYDVVNRSAECNQAQAFEWEWKAWDEFLSVFFKPIPAVTKYHHFRFSKDYPGYVFVRQSIDAQEVKVNILKRGKTIDYNASPALLIPAGMSKVRKDYVRQHIVPFCMDKNKAAFTEDVSV